MRIESAAQRISKIEKSAGNQSVYASAQKQRVRRGKERRARAAAENAWLSVQASYSLPLRFQNACQGGKRKIARGQRVRGYIGMGQSQRSKFLANRITRGPIVFKFVTQA
jgi:hypothetical protein